MYPWHVVLLCPVLAVLTVATPASAAQNGAVLHGTVADSATGEPVHGANVLLAGTGHGTATDAEGQYELEDISPGDYVVQISHVGYATVREEVSLKQGERYRLDVELSREDVQVEELIVEGKGSVEERASGVSRIPVQFIHDVPSVLEPDVFRSLQLLPGIQAASDYSSGLYIRGGTPDQTLVQLDGATLYNPTHAFGFFSTFNPDAIEAVDLYKGNYPANYGGRLGSVVDIATREGRSDRMGGGVSVGLLASRAFIEGPVGSGSYLLAFRRSTLEPVLSVLNRTDIEGVPERFHFYDISARTDIHIAGDSRLTLSLYTGSDALVLPFLEEEASFDVTYGNRMASAMWTHTFSDQLVGTLSASASRYFSDPVASITQTRVEQHNSVKDASFRGRVTWQASDRHEIELGAETGRVGFAVHNRFDEHVTIDHSSRSRYAAGYWQETLQPTDRWEVQAGLRVSYFEQGDHLRLSPRLSVERRLSSATQLRAGYGRYHQFMGLETNETMSAFDQWYPSAEGVPPSYGDQFVAGISAGIEEGTTLEVEGYFRTMRGLFRVNPFLADRTEMSYAETFLFGDGIAYGAEVLLQRDEGMLNGHIAYTLGLTRRSFEQINKGQWYPPKYDRTHDFTAVVNLDLSPQWRLTSVFRYATGQAYSPAVGQYRMVDERLVRSQGPGRVPVIDARFNAARLPSYHRLDLGITRRGRLFSSVHYEVQLQAINVYQQRNVWFYFFDVDTGDVPDQKDIPQIPVILPNLSLSLQF